MTISLPGLRLLFSVLLGVGTLIVPSRAAAKAEDPSAKTWAVSSDPTLPNVLILGDSISIGYGLAVRENLTGKANVYRPLNSDETKPENCQGTTSGVTNIDRWLAAREKWDVIHFNFGLHDLKHVDAVTGENSTKPEDPLQATVAHYARNLEVIVGHLKATGAKLIFATTTPIVADSQGPLREADAPAQYNAAALQIMAAHGIEINDLYTLCVGRLEELQLPQNVHFKQTGSEFLANQVAHAIEQKL
jgi:lysophospholipase L1-like esterase